MRNVHNKSLGNDEVQKTSSCYLPSNKRNKVRRTGEQRFSGTTSSDDDTISTSVKKNRFHLEFHTSGNVNQKIQVLPPSTEKKGTKTEDHRRSSTDCLVKMVKGGFPIAPAKSRGRKCQVTSLLSESSKAQRRESC